MRILIFRGHASHPVRSGGEYDLVLVRNSPGRRARTWGTGRRREAVAAADGWAAHKLPRGDGWPDWWRRPGKGRRLRRFWNRVPRRRDNSQGWIQHSGFDSFFEVNERFCLTTLLG